MNPNSSHLGSSPLTTESRSKVRAALSDLIAAIREATTVYRRRRAIRANIRRMNETIPF